MCCALIILQKNCHVMMMGDLKNLLELHIFHQFRCMSSCCCHHHQFLVYSSQSSHLVYISFCISSFSDRECRKSSGNLTEHQSSEHHAAAVGVKNDRIFIGSALMDSEKVMSKAMFVFSVLSI